MTVTNLDEGGGSNITLILPYCYFYYNIFITIILWVIFTVIACHLSGFTTSRCHLQFRI